ncbi:MAG TPA: aminoglycoside phosphotransferase family protein [Actinomycetes bacterium]|nr:aminoglycoside phosphotransferase family protein [Actinomycetes bacterium]
MYADEFDIDAELVRRLIAGQFAEWADLPIDRVEPAGTDNAVYRLGANLAVRLPRIESASDSPVAEHRWLPKLAPLLPLAIPEPIALGEPTDEYPWNWTVCRWLEGETAMIDRITDPHQAALDLAAFIAALERIDPAGGPPPDGRGGPIAERDEWMHQAMATLGDSIEVGAVTAIWELALEVPEWTDSPVWIHGDLDSRNMLVQRGRFSGVLDFGTMAVGDPACDVMVAWKLLPASARGTLRSALSVDDATWARARGWVLSQSLIALAYYTMETNPTLFTECERWLVEVLAD